MPSTGGEHNFHLEHKLSVADCGMRHECGSVESFGRVCEGTQRCMPSECLEEEAARIVELEREMEQLEDDWLTFLGKIDQVQKKIDEMTLNENHDAEFVAKVMNERDRVLAKKEKLSEEARKALERERREQRGHATQECRAGGRAGMQQTLGDWRWLLMGCLSLEAPSSLWTPPLSAHSMPTVYHDGTRGWCDFSYHTTAQGTEVPRVGRSPWSCTLGGVGCGGLWPVVPRDSMVLEFSSTR